MTEYTPTEDDLREALNHWLLVNRSADRRKFNGREGALDRFLAKERADAWDECLRTVVPKFIEVTEYTAADFRSATFARTKGGDPAVRWDSDSCKQWWVDGDTWRSDQEMADMGATPVREATDPQSPTSEDKS